jgi:GMP synthase (glutamine-hydrolysing)
VTDSIAILDYGSQYTQLIARRVREAHVYCELFPWDAPEAQVMALNPKGFILSGSPFSVYDPGAPTLPRYVLDSGLPVLGLCYGMQLLAHALGGKVAPSQAREYGPAVVELMADDPLWANIKCQISNVKGEDLKFGICHLKFDVWMSHGDRVESLPPGFVPLARSDNSPFAAMGDEARKLYGLQFHPEVKHTLCGTEILRAFLMDVCGCAPTWTPASFVEQSVSAIRAQVGQSNVVCGLSGGVDSSVAATLVHRAVGDQLTCIFVDTGMLRKGEGEQVVETFQRAMGMKLVAVNAIEDFLTALEGVADPEQKRKIIGEKFIRIFEREARALGADHSFLVQGTLYPDVIESRGPERQAAAKIKTHHNVGGLPADMQFKLVEPLRYLFKDEVRAVGSALGLPDEIVWRQPFPGPGLAVRVLGEVTWNRLQTLREAEAIVREELRAAGLEREIAQSFAVLLPVKSVGVMGDGRTYQSVVAVRAVTTDDFMTADWARIPPDVLARISHRIVNQVSGVNRVVYDITSKPPGTIEWE